MTFTQCLSAGTIQISVFTDIKAVASPFSLGVAVRAVDVNIGEK